MAALELTHSHVSRIDLIEKDAITLKDGKQITV